VKYLEPAKEIDVFGEYDVIVIGGGVAGLTAAIASGRNNAKTLIIEQFGYFGGTATASLMINVNYPRINAEASCFNEGLLSETEELPSLQASNSGYPSPTSKADAFISQRFSFFRSMLKR
jgi:heterodisulfide reductase subunit A-like polyferredoxin